jgi:hypothetical protein
MRCCGIFYINIETVHKIVGSSHKIFRTFHKIFETVHLIFNILMILDKKGGKNMGKVVFLKKMSLSWTKKCHQRGQRKCHFRGQKRKFSSFGSDI